MQTAADLRRAFPPASFSRSAINVTFSGTAEIVPLDLLRVAEQRGSESPDQRCLADPFRARRAESSAGFGPAATFRERFQPYARVAVKTAQTCASRRATLPHSLGRLPRRFRVRRSIRMRSGCVTREFEIGLADAVVELGWLPSSMRSRFWSARTRAFDGRFRHRCRCRSSDPAAARGRRCRAASSRRSSPSPRPCSLIREGRVGEPVGQDDCAPLPRRQNSLVEVLRAGREVQQHLGCRTELLVVGAQAGCGGSAGRFRCRPAPASRPLRGPRRSGPRASPSGLSYRSRRRPRSDEPAAPGRLSHRRSAAPSSDPPKLRAWRSDCTAAADRKDDTSPSREYRATCAICRASFMTPSLVPSSALAAVDPSAQIAFGRMTDSWRNRNSPQISISSGSGVRFSGGRHFTTLQMYTSAALERNAFFLRRALDHLREQLSGAADERNPCSSSSAPGPSPTNTSFASLLPEPKTILLRPSCRRQRWQSPMSSRIFSSVSSSGAGRGERSDW